MQRAVGENVRRLRTARGLTQLQFAAATGLSLSYVRRMEAGRANPRATTLALVARSLGVSEADLLTRDEQAT